MTSADNKELRAKIDEILLGYKVFKLSWSGSQQETADSKHVELAAELKALLTERERLSRIDELTKLRPYETNKEQMPSSVIYNRIAHLSNPERGEKK